MRVAPAVRLSPEERAQLLRRRRGRGERRLRAEIVLWAAEGAQDLEIGDRLGVNRQTAARWRRRFLASRLRGLDSPTSSMRAGRIPEETLQAIVRSTVARSPPGGGTWSTRRLARELGVSHMTVSRIWAKYGVRPVRYGAYPPRPDPVLPRAPGDVVGLFLRWPVSALALTLRSTPTERAGFDGPARGPGSAPSTPAFAGGSAGARTAAAFRALVGEKRDPAQPVTPAPGTFRRFLADLAIRAGRVEAVRVLASGVPPSERAPLDRWRVRHPEFEFEFSPDLPAWIDQARAELLASGRGPAPPGQFRGRGELSRSLIRSVATYSSQGGAFEWTARRREIAEGGAAYRLRYELAVTGHPGFKNPLHLARSMAPVSEPGGKDRSSARTVLRQYLRVQRRERVTIESWTATLDYANAFVLEALRIGARPLVLYQDEPTYWAATTEVPAGSLAHLGEHRRAALERTDVFVSFFGPSDRERFHALPAPTLFRLGEYQDALYEAAAKAGARSVQMAIGRVSDASARMYGVDVATWRRELIEGTLLSPSVLRRRARRLADRLEHGRELEVRHPNGTRLKLRLLGRKVHVADGAVRKPPVRGDWTLVTLPAGVVTVAVDESFAEGSFLSNVPCSTGLSDTVGEFRGARWTFEKGRIERFAYDEGQELFAQSYGRAREGREKPGSLSIGLNERIATSPLLEDQGLGTVGLHIGRNDHVGGKTRTPWWAWTFLRGSTVSVDGDPIVRGGQLAP